MHLYLDFIKWGGVLHCENHKNLLAKTLLCLTKFSTVIKSSADPATHAQSGENWQLLMLSIRVVMSRNA